MATILGRLGDPHLRYPVVHVAGSRGKGSTCALVASALAEAGHRTGLTTSPHLRHPRERIRIDGEPIPADELVGAVTEVRAACEELEVGFFEVMTAAAFLAFARRRVAIAVVEVGMGGRLDATNVVRPLVAVITRLGTDHADRLGPTRADIAREKAGIVKPGVPLVLAAGLPEAIDAVLERAREVGAPVTIVGPREIGLAPATALAGDAQRENAAVAAAALEVLAEASGGEFAVDRGRVERAFARVRWRGRLERLEGALGRDPRVDLLLDVAHDVDGAENLARFVADGTAVDAVVFACLAKKDLQGIASVLGGSRALARAAFFVPDLRGERSRPPGEIVEALAAEGLRAGRAGSVADALELAAEAARAAATRDSRPGQVVAFGSFVLAAAALRMVEPGEADWP